ncbi:thioesterase family protein [Microbacterium protaetiae]|uniref:Thioesterase family protein n=1 Tax=Microbacterium protaetiae TaxID=2509458 RepID=A0A4P6EA21_9MICO|nr:thioesterase family protein [Microbacterium protaetiae]QAY58980.1 thioesterase family protein [Microbacterium protaetiae]
MAAYFERLDETSFRATVHVQGAWNDEEQHVAPALGLMVHALERAHARRTDTPLQLSRVAFDILGVMPIDVVELTTRVVRPGRTIELVEAVLSHGGRPAVIGRAWFLSTADTAALAGSRLPPPPGRDDLERWDTSEVWPGRFVNTVETLRHQVEPGRAWAWMRPLVPLLEGETVSPTARLIGVVDIVNGLTVRASPDAVHFPNVDLTAHLLREPVGEWFAADTTVSFGPSGLGLTHTILHDDAGPLGTVSQSLTVRPR